MIMMIEQLNIACAWACGIIASFYDQLGFFKERNKNFSYCAI